MNKKKPLIIVLLSLLLLLCGCEQLEKIRTFFHPEEVPQGMAGNSAIHLDITPNTDLSIQLDGKTVATQTPFSARFLPPGQHQLLIEADNYLPFFLIFDLPEGKSLKLPIGLRPKPEGGGPTTPSIQESASRLGPQLPTQLLAKKIIVEINEPADIQLDDQPLNENVAIIDRAWGNLNIGSTSISYRLDSIGRLYFALENQEGWQINGEILEVGRYYALEKQLTFQAPVQAFKKPRLIRFSLPKSEHL